MPDTIQVETAVPISLANGNTLTFNYPAGRSANDYYQSAGAVISVRDLQNQFNQNVSFSLAYGEGSVVLSALDGLVIPAVQSAGAPKPPFGVVRLQLPLNVDIGAAVYPTRGGDQYQTL